MYVYGLCLFYLILRLEIYILRLIFTIKSPNGDLMILLISSPEMETIPFFTFQTPIYIYKLISLECSKKKMEEQI